MCSGEEWSEFWGKRQAAGSSARCALFDIPSARRGGSRRGGTEQQICVELRYLSSILVPRVRVGQDLASTFRYAVHHPPTTVSPLPSLLSSSLAAIRLSLPSNPPPIHLRTLPSLRAALYKSIHTVRYLYGLHSHTTPLFCSSLAPSPPHLSLYGQK